jgi:SAM-dependent methyltransferase
MNAKQHWEKVYREKDPVADVSWFQSCPAVSLKWIEADLAKNDPLIDVGGGASWLVDHLIDAGFRDVSVMDISRAALDHARGRLNLRAKKVTWIEADVTEFIPPKRFALWHDRAVFHFLTDAGARQNYIRSLKQALIPAGHVIIGTFAKDGPARCSGLDVVRYDAPSICAEFGDEFYLLEQLDEIHVTPWNSTQHFVWFRFERKRVGPMKIVSAL